MARVRSPAYPALSLPAAIEMTKKIHNVQQTTAEPREVVLRHMGYTGESGRALKSISALIKYGLLEKSGDEGLRVSSRAVSIIYPDPDDPKKSEMEMGFAAFQPKLFSEIFERWDTRPSEESLKAFLIRKGFNVNSVESVARAFYETYDLVSDFNDSYDSGNDLDEGLPEGESEMANDNLQKSKIEDAALPPSALNTTKPVFDFETVKIQTEIDNQEDLSELILRLEKIKSMLPSKTEH